MELTNKLKSLRTVRGVTQEALAAAMGVSAQAVSKWERGATTPDISLLPELAVYFGVSLDELFGLTEEKEYDRIQNVLWDKRLLPYAEFDQAERWLNEKIAAGYRVADCHRLKADLYNHQAGFLSDLAAEAAMAALAADPNCTGAHSELNTAMHGFIPDWCARNHRKEIAFYQEFTRNHPDDWRAWMWLLDNLLDDRRFPEAEQALEGLARADDTFRTPYYRGLLLWYRDRREDAHAVWDQMLRDHSEDWFVRCCLGDVAAMELRYADAIDCYRSGIELQQSPKYVDGFESIAQICELMGDDQAAIGALEEELELLKQEWNTTEGETADVVKREIARLRAKK